MLTSILVCSLIFLETLSFSPAKAAIDVTGIINSDTTWTKANGPYEIHIEGVLILSGVTLTIEPGVTINLNGNYMNVNGTLHARGTSTDKITFNDGWINFTNFSESWNEQTSSGCIIENANLKSVTIRNAAAKIVSCSIWTTSVRDTAIISDCNVTDEIEVLNGSPVISNNNITTSNKTYPTQPINTIQPTPAIIIDNGSPTISNNFITAGGDILDNYGRANGIVYAVSVSGGSPLISNNTIVGNGDEAIASDGSPTIINNNVIGYVGILLGSATISGNVIRGIISAASSFTGSTIISNNTVILDKWTDYSIRIVAGMFCTVSDNIITGGGIEDGFLDTRGGSDARISGNIVYNCNTAPAIIFQHAGSATIEKNLIIGNYDGIQIRKSASLTIRNNTIANNNFYAITVQNSPVVSINYNNIQNNTNSLSVETLNDINATYNWWGTTDVTAINQSISDYKNNFLVGRANFVPILTSQNAAAPSNNTIIPPVIPEFQTPGIMLAILLATVIVSARNKDRPKYLRHMVRHIT
jgi:parallel beta-helix repeat protein